MLARMLARQKQPQPYIRDRVICFDEQERTCEIMTVTEESEEVVRTDTKTFPKADLNLTLSKHGKVYVFRAPTKIVELTEHLAQVEKNTVIRQIAAYKKPFEEQFHRPDVMKFVLIGALVLVSIIAIVK